MTTRSHSKQCFKCSKAKPLAEFYRHAGMADGHLGKCKECTKTDVAERRLVVPDKLREYELSRKSLPHRRVLARNTTKAWRAADERRQSCHNKVARALRSGEIRKESCMVCGSSKTVAHHEDYDKPLAVWWLCETHHKARHSELKVGANA